MSGINWDRERAEDAERAASRFGAELAECRKQRDRAQAKLEALRAGVRADVATLYGIAHTMREDEDKAMAGYNAGELGAAEDAASDLGEAARCINLRAASLAEYINRSES